MIAGGALWEDVFECMEDMHSCPTFEWMYTVQANQSFLQEPWQLGNLHCVEPSWPEFWGLNYTHCANEASLCDETASSLEGCVVLGKASFSTKTRSRKQRRQRLRQALQNQEKDSLASAQCVRATESKAGKDFLDSMILEIKCMGHEKFVRDRIETASEQARSKMFDEVLAHIRTLTVDAVGHILIIKLFQMAGWTRGLEDARETLFQSVVVDVPRLGIDEYGHFLLLRFFELATPDEQSDFIHSLTPHVLVLANDQWGCKILQALLEKSTRDQQSLLASSFRKRVVKSAENQYANFVLQKCIEQMRPDDLAFIGGEIKGRVRKLSHHECSCRVIQRLLEHWSWAKSRVFVEEILQNVSELSESRYGNYIVQQVLQDGRFEDQKRIIKAIEANVVTYAKNKYSSRVVEKCFEVLELKGHPWNQSRERRAFAASVLGDVFTNWSSLFELANHHYGNYVVQQAIKCCHTFELASMLLMMSSWRSENGSSINPHVIAAVRRELAH